MAKGDWKMRTNRRRKVKRIYEPLPELVKEYLRDRQDIQESSKYTYGQILLYFDRFLRKNGCSLENFNRRIVNQYIEELKNKKNAPRYIELSLTAIRKFAKFLKDELDLETSENRRQVREFDKIQDIRVKLPKRKDMRTALSKEQVRELMDKTADPELRGMLILGLGFGFRQIEYTQALVTDIDLNNKRILVHGKGQKDRLVPISSMEQEMEIKNLLKWRSTLKNCNVPYIFPTYYRGQWKQATVTAIKSRFKTIRKNLSFHFTSHQLRITLATELRKNGVEQDLIKEILGHKDINTTLKYTRLKDHEVDEMYRKATRGMKFY